VEIGNDLDTKVRCKKYSDGWGDEGPPEIRILSAPRCSSCDCPECGGCTPLLMLLLQHLCNHIATACLCTIYINLQNSDQEDLLSLHSFVSAGRHVIVRAKILQGQWQYRREHYFFTRATYYFLCDHLRPRLGYMRKEIYEG
jgi:hypothetical protein